MCTIKANFLKSFLGITYTNNINKLINNESIDQYQYLNDLLYFLFLLLLYIHYIYTLNTLLHTPYLIYTPDEIHLWLDM